MEKKEHITQADYSEVMQKSYIDYAMSVIVARALPDVRDGLKPVQRRTLYDMYGLGNRWDRPYRKCARIVGDTMGKYHPHGDSSIYGALVAMAQGFRNSMPLVDGHGNFGSIEGDGAAAMRYTEARLQKFTQEVYLADMEKGVVDFVPNFDATEKEPSVLPARVPNILVNGAEGIAVGMATSIPPHNLGEVCEGVIAYMKNPGITLEEMMEVLPGPDFPTGGIVINRDALKEIYGTGSGKIRLRGKVRAERGKDGKTKLVITEIPYTMAGANIGKFLGDVGALAEDRVTNDIADISNQSSKEGIRIVIDLKKGADAENVINLLYKKTKLEDTFGVNMLAVSDGKPETMGLLDVIRHSVDFQYGLAKRKYAALLEHEQAKREVQEGLIKACGLIDLIIEILKGSRNAKQAKACLVEGATEGIAFKTKASLKKASALRFTEKQAEAILEMKLGRLVGLEVEALEKEHKRTLKDIAFYGKVLGSRAEMTKVLVSDLKKIKEEFASPRKTALEDAPEAVFEEGKREAFPLVLLVDRLGYVKAVDRASYDRGPSAGEGCRAAACMSDDKVCVFTDTGRMHLLKASDIPLGKAKDRGVPLDNVCGFSSREESLAAFLPLGSIKDGKLLFVTKRAMVKRVEGSEFDVSKRTTAATGLAEGDSLLFAGALGENDTFVLRSEKGFFLRLKASDIPEKKKGALGVRGMRLAEGDAASGVYVLNGADSPVLTVRNGEVALNRLRIGNRDTKGVLRGSKQA